MVERRDSQVVTLFWDAGSLDEGATVEVTGDQPRRGQVQHGMQVVAHAHIERCGGAIGEHGIVPGRPARPDQGENETARQAGDQNERAHQHGPRLGA